ncbi:cupin domain-containing protein [Thiobacter aerophilum]|uniref:Cupin domain-containing protein n=1 Tax=Thiobacter aerophilum TaxID=3121275 RepID=A0ABV0EHI4_9BURK
MIDRLLGFLTPRQFLARYWQKAPLFVPQALPEFRDVLTPAELKALAAREDVQARLVVERDGVWSVRHGPLSAGDFRGLKGARWSLLVQGVDQVLPEGKALLQAFSFIPYARLDDLMVSFAPAGGGVGPHFDSYDVFLLQGLGHKRWQISGQRDRRLVQGAPLRILERFRAEQEWTAGSGDLLYLPPKYAHYGVALDDCLTYSIGFRAPSAQELVTQFLAYLEENLQVTGMYEDPDLRLKRHPAEIDGAMLDKVAHLLEAIRWNRAQVADFLGRYLTEPKPHLFFEPPSRPLGFGAFVRVARTRGVRLSLKSLMLFHGPSVFINGEALRVASGLRGWLTRLADGRELAGLNAAPRELFEILYEWYRAGWLELPAARRSHG